MIATRTGAAPLLGWLALACSSADATFEDQARLVTVVSQGDQDACVATQCVDVASPGRLAYLALDGADCDGGALWELDLYRLDAAGDFVAIDAAPAWEISDPACIGRADPMWHVRDLAGGTYRLCAHFHDTASAGPLILYARAEGRACVQQSSVGLCTACATDVPVRADPGAGARARGHDAGGSTPDHGLGDATPGTGGATPGTGGADHGSGGAMPGAGASAPVDDDDGPMDDDDGPDDDD